MTQNMHLHAFTVTAVFIVFDCSVSSGVMNYWEASIITMKSRCN